MGPDVDAYIDSGITPCQYYLRAATAAVVSAPRLPLNGSPHDVHRIGGCGRRWIRSEKTHTADVDYNGRDSSGVMKALTTRRILMWSTVSVSSALPSMWASLEVVGKRENGPLMP